ncbi:MAG: BMP family ABC transporter substrate-binding protein [Candidatus Muiribacteriota bacterium]
MPFRAEDDPTFGHMVLEGVNQITQDFDDITINYVYPAQNISFESYVRYFSLSFDVIVGAGYMYDSVIESAAKSYPDNTYILIDSKVEGENIISILFDDKQAAYIAGAVSEILFPGKKKAFIGANPSPLMDNFYFGFVNGITDHGNSVNITREYISNDITGFASKIKAEYIAENLYSKNTQIIFAPVGQSSMGVLRAARKSDNHIIGIDRPFEDFRKQNVAFSIIKRVDKALYNIISKIYHKKEVRNENHFDFSNGGYEISDKEFFINKYGQKQYEKIMDLCNNL